MRDHENSESRDDQIDCRGNVRFSTASLQDWPKERVSPQDPRLRRVRIEIATRIHSILDDLEEERDSWCRFDVCCDQSNYSGALALFVESKGSIKDQKREDFYLFIYFFIPFLIESRTVNLPPVTLISLDDVVCRIDSITAREHSIHYFRVATFVVFWFIFAFSRLVRILLDAMITIEFNPISLIYSTRINHISSKIEL